jgi:hypothetical protein
MKLSEVLADLHTLRVCVRVSLFSPPVGPGHLSHSGFPVFINIDLRLTDANFVTLIQDPKAALAFVSARPESTQPLKEGETERDGEEQKSASAERDEQDVDLKRVQNLIELHYSVKVAHTEGKLEKELMEARRMVQEAMAGLQRGV